MGTAVVIQRSRNPIVAAAFAGLEKERRLEPKPEKPSAAARPKEHAERSEEYRRLVAAQPCINCGRVGYSQAAHPPPTGKQAKEDDLLCFPLCTVHPMSARSKRLEEGCHEKFDQRRLIPTEKMRAQALKWGRQTKAAVIAAGQASRKLLALLKARKA